MTDPDTPHGHISERDLIDTLARQGCHVTVRQVRRWVMLGLLEKPIVLCKRDGSICRHPWHGPKPHCTETVCRDRSGVVGRS